MVGDQFAVHRPYLRQSGQKGIFARHLPGIYGVELLLFQDDSSAQSGSLDFIYDDLSNHHLLFDGVLLASISWAFSDECPLYRVGGMLQYHLFNHGLFAMIMTVLIQNFQTAQSGVVFLMGCALITAISCVCLRWRHTPSSLTLTA